MTEALPLPAGFRIGHWTAPDGRTGCTVVIPPPGSRGGVDIRGGGTGTREIETLSLLANAEGPTAVLLTGGSAFGLAAADGVVRWLEERGFGRPTPMGVVPLVPAAVIYDLVEGAAGRRPGPDDGYAACDNATATVPQRGPVGAGAGAAVGKLLGRERSTRGGVGYAATVLADGATVAALAVANAFGDVIAEDGSVLGGPHDGSGHRVRTADLLPGMPVPAVTPVLPVTRVPGSDGEGVEGNTTLVCVFTDASLDKRTLCDRRADGQRRNRARGRSRVHTGRRRRRVLCRLGKRPAARAGPRGVMGAHRARERGRYGHGARNPGRRPVTAL